jgi:hypothetical protein
VILLESLHFEVPRLGNHICTEYMSSAFTGTVVRIPRSTVVLLIHRYDLTSPHTVGKV